MGTSDPRSSWRQLKAMLRKNWLLKIRHPFSTLAEILLPTIIMLSLIAIRTRVDTQIHPVQANVRKGMFVEVGNSEVSASFDSLLKLLLARKEHLAFAPDTNEMRKMLDALSLRYPLLQMVILFYEDELALETYIRSELYGSHDNTRNLSNPKIRGAIVLHEHGPQMFDYSIRLNHTWAFSGFPDVKTIMDVNGPYLNDLELGASIVPTLQYGFSGFLTLQQVMDTLIISIEKQDVNYSDTSYKMDETFQLFGSPRKLNSSEFIPTNIRIVPFPTREYTDDEFQSLVKAVMGVLYLLGFLFPISRLISYSVFEKEQKIKEGLQMMGLRNKTFYLSWFITYTLQFAISSAIITTTTANSLFKYSDKSLVFIYFFLFSLSAIMLSFFISTFFSRAKTAVAVGSLSFIGAFFPYYSVNDPSIPMVWKISASLLSPAAFALGTINFADYERAHVGVRWTNMWQASSGVNFMICLLMMMLDTIIYCFFGLCFEKVLPREGEVLYSWKFLFHKLILRKKVLFNDFDSPDLQTYELPEEECHFIDGSFESISFDMKQQEIDGRCIKIMNLHKVYTSKKGKCCAVNFLNLSLYENQILALLGHNGAGKSSTISMLVGLIPPTSGDALVFGKKITTDIADIRKVLGVCPQHDILFSELTVKEHMVMCAALKGVDEDYLESNVTEMINEVGLADKVNSVVGTLSGGMKRKLSLGIALIGNSKVIILDEPTSGMDPYAMRSTWQLIKKIKKGRIILLTTHSMDEADILGDRIAIMASGRLRCCGSSLFLKNRYGVGYTLTIAKTSPGSSVGAEIVHHHVPAAECISDVGSEVSFRLPLASSSLFVNMFREIESCIRRPNIEDNSSFVESNCGIESYGISVTTLEEVFLKVAGQRLDEVNFHQYQMNLDKSDAPDCQVSQITLSGLAISKRYCGYSCELFIWFLFAAGQVCSLVVSNIYGFTVLTLVKLCSCGTIVKSVFWVHLKALFIKRAISARRDSKTVAFQLLIPAIFMLLGLLFLRIKPHPDQGSVELTTSHFNPLLSGGGGGGPIPFNLYSPVAEKVASYVMGGWIQNAEPRSFRFPQPEKVLADAIEAAGPKLGPLLLSMSEYLISSLNESYQSRYGAVVMDDLYADGSLGYTILHNCSCQHAAPTFINLVNAAILRLATGNSNKTIRIRNHPLPLTMSQHAQRHDLDAFSASVIVSMAFSFIPASYAVSIVKEREVKAKQQQLISGVSIFAYWISTFLWDFFSFLFPASLAVFLFFIFDLKQFVGYDCLLPTIMIFLEYGAAVAASTYCLTFFFTDHSIAQNVVLLVHFLGGLILMVISFIMGLVNATQTANSFLKNFFRLSPAFCFADGLASLALRHQDMKLGSKHQILDWKVTGASLCYLAVEIVVYFIMTISLEYIPHYKIKLTISKVWCNLFHYVKYDTSQSYSEPLLGSSSMFMTDEDVDVIAERQRILNGLGDNAIICLQNLRKVYPAVKKHAAKVAVHSLTFAVHEGECFGFLGTNGAGKTTTLSMLTGEECPTDGTAYVFGTEVRSNPKSARQHIGYCPQFDALFEFLTPREHLMLYAKIKYVPEDIINDVVNEKLVEFDLWNHAEKPAYTLSGGNKRKLSVAIAMIGDPPIVILDEPSTGMDPIAKRFMWDVISNLSTRRGKTAVILTTHSMNEAQALCTRIGIMVDGKLRCIGSPQHLKSRYGNHLELELKPTEVSTLEVDDLCNNIQEMLYDFPKDARGILGDLETCILGSSIVASKSIAEISLTTDMLILIANLFGNENSIKTIISSNPVSDGVFGEQLSEQLLRDGSIPLRIFCEWWLAKQKFTQIDSFILASFPGAKFHGCNGLSVKYELPYGEDSSLADIFGHLENNRRELGIEDYRISQATLETIFNDFAGGAA